MLTKAQEIQNALEKLTNLQASLDEQINAMNFLMFHTFSSNYVQLLINGPLQLVPVLYEVLINQKAAAELKYTALEIMGYLSRLPENKSLLLDDKNKTLSKIFKLLVPTQKTSDLLMVVIEQLAKNENNSSLLVCENNVMIMLFNILKSNTIGWHMKTKALNAIKDLSNCDANKVELMKGDNNVIPAFINLGKTADLPIDIKLNMLVIIKNLALNSENRIQFILGPYKIVPGILASIGKEGGIPVIVSAAVGVLAHLAQDAVNSSQLLEGENNVMPIFITLLNACLIAPEIKENIALAIYNLSMNAVNHVKLADNMTSCLLNFLRSEQSTPASKAYVLLTFVNLATNEVVGAKFLQNHQLIFDLIKFLRPQSGVDPTIKKSVVSTIGTLAKNASTENDNVMPAFVALLKSKEVALLKVKADIWGKLLLMARVPSNLGKLITEHDIGAYLLTQWNLKSKAVKLSELKFIAYVVLQPQHSAYLLTDKVRLSERLIAVMQSDESESVRVALKEICDHVNLWHTTGGAPANPIINDPSKDKKRSYEDEHVSQHSEYSRKKFDV